MEKNGKKRKRNLQQQYKLKFAHKTLQYTVTMYGKVW